MLHELIFALNGYPGSIFVEKEGTFSVTKGLPFMHPSETLILDRLCALGYHVKYLRTFVSTHRSLIASGAQGDQRPVRRGLYLHAVCSGLQKVLYEYADELLVLEKEVLGAHEVSLMRFQERLEKYHLLFLKLHDLVAEIESSQVHGCNILQSLHRSCTTALPVGKASMSLLLQAGYGVLCQQISSWVLYGILRDPYQEFFVEALGGDPSLTEPNTSSSCLEAPLASMQDFRLKSNLLLPEQLSQSFASKVLFAGSAVRVFGQSGERPVYTAEQEAEFLKRLQKISESEEIDLFQLETFVEDVRSAAAAHLWKLFVEEGRLPSQLRLLRDAFLLGRGELFLHFSQVAEHILCQVREPTTEHITNGIFQQACSLLQSDDENLAEQFRITIGPTGSHDSSEPHLACWETIGLNYKVEPPLHVFFTSSIMSKYNRLFRLLFGLQRAQTFLQECWMLQCKVARAGHLHKSDLMRDMMLLRAEMAHLLNSIQYYLQVDVIEIQLGRLLTQVMETRDFEAIQHVHNAYLASLLKDSMIMLQPVHNCFKSLFVLSKSLHGIFPVSIDKQLSQRQFSEFERIEQEFQSNKRLLIKVLSSLHSKLSETQPSQLLVRLDPGCISALATN
ncbi:gamma-tubulin complex component 4-like isoform X2 [Rhipicephalus microplus]|uniref:gamma-tubulin complex component 4-like isoform X2 n=1 Tax=Rhipicephalus microplus TaxID=6941 RepID=UPI003F6D6467